MRKAQLRANPRPDSSRRRPPQRPPWSSRLADDVAKTGRDLNEFNLGILRRDLKPLVYSHPEGREAGYDQIRRDQQRAALLVPSKHPRPGAWIFEAMKRERQAVDDGAKPRAEEAPPQQRCKTNAPNPREPEPEAIEIWARALGELERSLNRHSFATWFRCTSGSRVVGKHLAIEVPAPQWFWLRANYAREIYAALVGSSVEEFSIEHEGAELERIPAEPEFRW